MPGFYADPMADDNGIVTKAGFDCTAPAGQPDTIDYRRAFAPAGGRATPRFNSVLSALEANPMHFGELVAEPAGEDDAALEAVDRLVVVVQPVVQYA